MMQMIDPGDLRSNSYELLRRVQAGESFSVVEDGVVIAVLVPPSDYRTNPSLHVRKASKRAGFSQIASVWLDHPIQPEMDELRGDR